MSHYVAAYDISHPGHRQQVAQFLAAYGQRVQRSVFEIWVESEELATLKRRIGTYLAKEDLFDLFPLDRRDPERRIRWQHPPPGQDPVVLL